MKTVIGIVGEKGSGKGTFTELFRELSQNPIGCVKSSDILAETLRLWKIPLTRKNLQDLAIIMDGHYGTGSLSNAVRERIASAKEDIVIFEGIRWQSDVDMVESFPNHLIVYVTAPVDVRYQRTRERKEKVGEGEATFEEFMKEEKVSTETQIASIGEKAGVKIGNLGSKSEFREKIREHFVHLF